MIGAGAHGCSHAMACSTILLVLDCAEQVGAIQTTVVTMQLQLHGSGAAPHHTAPGCPALLLLLLLLAMRAWTQLSSEHHHLALGFGVGPSSKLHT
jgi:tryptophan synthase beta subunit